MGTAPLHPFRRFQFLEPTWGKNAPQCSHDTVRTRSAQERSFHLSATGSGSWVVVKRQHSVGGDGRKRPDRNRSPGSARPSLAAVGFRLPVDTLVPAGGTDRSASPLLLVTELFPTAVTFHHISVSTTFP
jgi:hypothetical protein